MYSCSEDNQGTSNTDPVPANTSYDISTILSKFEGTGLSYEVSGNTVIFTTQDLPNHTSPYWDTNNPLFEAYNGNNNNFRINPGSIGAQNIVFTISLNPSMASNHQVTNLGPIGISRNGVVIDFSRCVIHVNPAAFLITGVGGYDITFYQRI